MTTTKELNANVFSYILNAVDGEGYGKVLTSDKDKLQFIADCFNSEYGHKENIKYYGSYSNCFKNWLMGLPSCFNIDFENYRIIEIAKEWNSLPANATDRQEDKILDNWFSFITNKTFQLMKKNNILPYTI